MREAEIDATVAALGWLHLAQKELFDTVDQLRSLGVGKIVDLPQIVVCGDQSSGKSSVLEAISRVRFPVKTDICTRFATELILRTHPTTVIDVSIEWQDDRGTGKGASSKPREEKLGGPDDNRDIPQIIEEARKRMGVDGARKTVSTDVLRIRVSAPDVPNLTLVDLPGFYHGSGGGQNYDDRLVVDELARRYLSRNNTIILAVVGARASINQQKVLDEVRAVDPKRERFISSTTPGSLFAICTDSMLLSLERRALIPLSSSGMAAHRPDDRNAASVESCSSLDDEASCSEWLRTRCHAYLRRVFSLLPVASSQYRSVSVPASSLSSV